MEELKKAKMVYDSINVPNELNYVVHRSIAKQKKNKNRIFYYFKILATTTVASFVLFVVTVNSNSTFASSISEVPIIGDIARIFTIKEYQEEDELKLVNVKMPALENTGNTELENRINYEILTKINEKIEEAEKRAEEYRDAVIQTGGSLEDFHPINIEVNYEVKYSTNEIVSFVINKFETLASAYNEQDFYNIDITNGKELNLRDVLGPDYKQIVDSSIKKQIEEREKNSDNTYFDVSDGGFDGIEDEYQNFYINESGNVVIVFQKYEIAPGYMGIQEFEIQQ